MSKISLQFLVIILLLLILCTTRIQKLTVENDNCNNHFLLDFGFQEGGIFKIQVDYVLLDPPPNQMKTLLPIGFIADSTSGISEEDPSCSLLLQPNNESIFSIRKTQEDWKRGFTFQTVMNETKLYSIWYSNCYQDLPLSTYEITLNLKNPNSYLSAGEIPLPTIYILFFVIYLLLFVSWQMFLKKKAGKKYKIHSLMTVLLIAKSLSIFSKSVEYYLISSTGKSKGADIAYYIFHFLKGVLLFAVIILIASGWSFIKETLSSLDKKFFFVIIFCQILANIGIIIIEETIPGAKGWWTWEQILKYVDIICIGCIIFRIMDTMNQLKRASEVGGKNSENLKKLRMFKEFYLVTIGYIYLTRIILIIFEQILPFRFTWLSQFFEELFTFIFYFYVGYRFRPVKDSLYHQLSNSTDSENGQVINLEQINDENETIKRVKHSQDDDFIEDDDGDNMFQKTEEEKNNTSGESNFDEI